MIAALPDAPPVLLDDDGASYLTYRDDRFRCVAGQENLQGYALRPNSPTQRFVASCCNSAMYLKYKRGHWVSTYRNRYDPTDLPAVEMCTNTRFRTAESPLDPAIPAYRRFPLRLFGKLIGARINMALGR